MESVRVEVLPVAADRWIGVIDGERGAFSTATSIDMLPSGWRDLPHDVAESWWGRHRLAGMSRT
jgi:hypothetical protein